MWAQRGAEPCCGVGCASGCRKGGGACSPRSGVQLASSSLEVFTGSGRGGGSGESGR